jgi:hypothetical protein
MSAWQPFDERIQGGMHCPDEKTKTLRDSLRGKSPGFLCIGLPEQACRFWD